MRLILSLFLASALLSLGLAGSGQASSGPAGAAEEKLAERPEKSADRDWSVRRQGREAGRKATVITLPDREAAPEKAASKNGPARPQPAAQTAGKNSEANYGYPHRGLFAPEEEKAKTAAPPREAGSRRSESKKTTITLPAKDQRDEAAEKRVRRPAAAAKKADAYGYHPEQLRVEPQPAPATVEDKRPARSGRTENRRTTTIRLPDKDQEGAVSGPAKAGPKGRRAAGPDRSKAVEGEAREVMVNGQMVTIPRAELEPSAAPAEAEEAPKAKSVRSGRDRRETAARRPAGEKESRKRSARAEEARELSPDDEKRAAKSDRRTKRSADGERAYSDSARRSSPPKAADESESDAAAAAEPKALPVNSAEDMKNAYQAFDQVYKNSLGKSRKELNDLWGFPMQRMGGNEEEAAYGFRQRGILGEIPGEKEKNKRAATHHYTSGDARPGQTGRNFACLVVLWVDKGGRGVVVDGDAVGDCFLVESLPQKPLHFER